MLFVAALFATVVPIGVQAGTSPRLVVERTWVPPLVPPEWNNSQDLPLSPMAADADRRTLWMIEDSWVVSYDLDSLTPNSTPLKAGWLRDQPSAFTLDRASGRLVIGLRNVTAVFNGGEVPSAPPSVLLLQRSGDTLSTGTTIGLGASQQGRMVVGLSSNRDGRYLYVLTGVDPVLSGGGTASPALQLIQVDLTATPPAATWTYTLPPNCPRTPSEKIVTSSVSSFGYDVRSQSVYLACGGGANTSLYRVPILEGVGRIRLGADQSAPQTNAFDLYPVPGGLNMLATSFDPTNGILALTYQSAGSNGNKAGIFSTVTNAYVGDIAAGIFSPMTQVIDEKAARLYMYAPYFGMNLMISELGVVPTQAYTDQSLRKYNTGSTSPTFSALDESRNRIFLPSMGNGTGASDAFVVVVHDTATPLSAAPPSDPDRNTTDIPEHEGVTDHTFSGSAQAYGAVVEQVGGIAGLETSTGEPDAPDPSTQGNPTGRFAYLGSLSLNLDEALASSIPADRDTQYTGQQQQTLCANSPPQLQNTTCPWTFVPATCSSFAARQDAASSGPDGNASVVCDPALRKVSASADVEGVQGIGEAGFTASVLEVDKAGLTTQATSEARNVSLLGGALRIGSVRVTATARAGGHPGTAGTTLVREVDHVVLDGSELCATNCDLSAVAQQVAVAFDNRVRVTFPQPDATQAAGSPGGFLSAIRRTPADHADDVFREQWTSDRWELPGMEITEINDVNSPARTDIRLAGVEVEARYGIYALGQFAADTGADQTAQFPAPTTSSLVDTSLLASEPGAAMSVAPSQAAPGATGPRTLLAGLPSWHGWQWLLQHPGQALRFAATWLLLLLPVHLAARRWMLIRRQTVFVES